MMVRLALHLLSFLWMYPMARAPYEKRMRLIRRLGTPFSAWLAIGLGTTSIDAQTPSDHSLGHSLTFAASFDHGVDADYSSGDAALWWAPSMNKRKEAQKGLPPSGEVEWQRQGGKFGGSLRFDQSKGPMVFFRGDKNYPAPKSGWNATVSFWLSTEPQTELPDGFCDPLQITSKQWDDASIFVEFEKRPNAIPFPPGSLCRQVGLESSKQKVRGYSSSGTPFGDRRKATFFQREMDACRAGPFQFQYRTCQWGSDFVPRW